MGPARTIEFLKRTGESFEIDYGQEETSWEKVKENFEEFNGCIFSGPIKTKHILYFPFLGVSVMIMKMLVRKLDQVGNTFT